MMHDERFVEVYKYCARTGILTVQKKLRPRFLPIGEIESKGPSVCLAERNDELARKILLEYELQKLADLQNQIERKLEVIKKLEEG